MSDSPAILATRLRKEFGSNIAVRGLDLEVRRGEVFGFLGPNGAGKTTSIKMFLDLVHPTSGEVCILGIPANDPRVRAQVGFLPEHFRFHDWLSADEFLKLHGHLHRMPEKDLALRIEELLDLVGLVEFRSKYLKTYSKGMLQRIGLAQALLNRPSLVFLDEPTSGLDPVGRRLVRDIIRTLRDAGTTVFLNSHLLSEVEITCDRVAFIKHGEVLRISELSHLVDGEISLSARVQQLRDETLDGLAQWGRDIRKDGEHIQMVIEAEDQLPAIHRFLVASGADVYAFTPQRVSLEDLFIQIVGTDGGL
jgi:ABC-2 type transport system ATP-binding protein